MSAIGTSRFAASERNFGRKRIIGDIQRERALSS